MNDATRTRRGAVTLTVWYAAAVAVPLALGGALLGREFYSDPRDELVKPCDDPLECGRLFPNAAEVISWLVPFLLVSLVVAVPVHLVLLRRTSPVAAGSLAAVTAWTACLTGACVLAVLFDR